MKNTHLAKTLTASLPGNPLETFSFIADPDNLPKWYSSFCRALRKESGSIHVESPRGSVPVRFVRDDHSLVLDIIILAADSIQLRHAIRLLPNGEGTEIVWTIVKPQGLSDSIFHEQLRWAGSALHFLRKAPAPAAAPIVSAVAPDVAAESIAPAGESSEPLQAPSADEISSMPLSGKKLFIGNLAYDWTDDQLRAHFSEQGVVVIAEIARFRGRNGRSRGFGFVEMTTEAEAQTAIEKLHGGTAGGRQIIVRLAKSQESRPARAAESSSETAAAEPIEPGNQREPGAPAQRSRSERPQRTPRGGRPRPESSRRTNVSAGGTFTRRIPGRQPGSTARPYQEQDISNKSGYEIFPRRAPGTPDPTPSSGSEPTAARPNADASPYMDDTGDIENHGRRPPRQRRTR